MARFFVEDDRIINVDEIAHVIKVDTEKYKILFRNSPDYTYIPAKTYEALRAFIKGLGQTGTV